ncbi:hypothetical protein L7F22_069280 [Adiantum nelumboides]|nr:hypothetical protein [Adiantum nelumboides]
MPKASVKRSPAKRASKNAVVEEPLLLEATLQKNSPLQWEKKRTSADFEVFASNSKAPTKVAKAAYQYPRLSKFCYLAEDLHSEYGLSLEGKLPRDIADDKISDKDWLTVFKCLHQKNTKLYISSVREDKCRLLYQKVYQAAPSNGELLAKFSRGFVYERSRASSDPDSHRIAWARFGGAVLDNCKLQKGGLERNINKFHADYGIVKLEASNYDVAVSSIPTISASKLEGRQVVEQPMYMEQVLNIAEGISKELDQEQEQLAKSAVTLIEGEDSKNSEVLGTQNCIHRARETKDGSCCLDSYDEDHSDLSNSFQMKGTASDDIANVLQGMAKVTTENSPILVLEEPSGKMDNASTLVEDKDKNSTVDSLINFSIDVPPVHEGEDHEKNTTLDPVSKVSIDSAEGDHGKDKIVDPASKLSADNPEGKNVLTQQDLNSVGSKALLIMGNLALNPESEATNDMDDPELGETLRFMAAHMKKKRKQELEEGPANPNRIKIRVVNYPSSKSLDDSDTPINIDKGLGKYSTLLLDDSSYKNHLNEKGTYVVLSRIEQQSEEQWDGFLRNDVLRFLYTWVDAKEEDRFKIVKECNFDVSESAEQHLDMLFIKKNLEGGGTIYPPRNLGLHENLEPKNPGSAAGDPGFASRSPRKHGHPRPQYKRPGTQWHK